MTASSPESAPRGGSRNAVWITLIVAVALLAAFAVWMLRPAPTAAQPVPTATVTVTPSPVPVESEDPPVCTDAGLKTTATPDAAAGTQYVTITFQNTGGAECTLAGYPQVRFFDEEMGYVGIQPEAAEGIMPGVVQLPVGATASAVLTVADPDMVQGCTSYRPGHMWVISPGGAYGTSIPAGVAICTVEDTRAYPAEATTQISPVMLDD